MDISVYSLAIVARHAAESMPNGGAIETLTYFGGERVVSGYNLMGVCKAALDASVRYLAYDLGPKKIRVNAVSAGPVKTLAASAVGDSDKLAGLYEAVSPLRPEHHPRGSRRGGHVPALRPGERHHRRDPPRRLRLQLMGSPGRAIEAAKAGTIDLTSGRNDPCASGSGSSVGAAATCPPAPPGQHHGRGLGVPRGQVRGGGVARSETFVNAAKNSAWRSVVRLRRVIDHRYPHGRVELLLRLLTLVPDAEPAAGTGFVWVAARDLPGLRSRAQRAGPGRTGPGRSDWGGRR